MGLKIETWSIAYRKRKSGLLNDLNGFKVLNNGRKGWYADPFLYGYDGETYLFAEYYSYNLSRGIIVYSKYEKDKDAFNDFEEIIIEDYHLSYPVIFNYNNKIYMMPESNESNALYLYEAVDFPRKWKKLPAVMEDIKLVDTTPIILDDELYALTLRLNDEGGDLLLLEFDGEKFNITEQGILTNDMGVARPGGNFITDDGIFRISQDCSKGYGDAVNLIKLGENFVRNYNETLIKKITPENIGLLNEKLSSGVHTYNCSDDFEVIDLKYYRRSYYRIIQRIISKLSGK